ncbi:uncharacterized protein LOC121395998 [Xenopus laevis]|uniref:Uncharacterized protein LOC121395998 n=1 Tax=Xenopus laevis TaxID=8355 RepID=A0A8J1LB54_XENLA|nr:uncharacterized protein LOC121395998 [Xenopus laevis]
MSEHRTTPPGHLQSTPAPRGRGIQSRDKISNVNLSFGMSAIQPESSLTRSGSPALTGHGVAELQHQHAAQVGGTIQNSDPYCRGAASYMQGTSENPQFLSDLIKEVGQQISHSIITGLAAQNTRLGDTAPVSDKQTEEWAKLNWILNAKVKEPPVFRGDENDKCTVYEWEEIMQSYLTKKGYQLAEHGKEIMDRLMGRAKELVKIGVRNNPSIDIKRDPRAIYSILKQHFGEAISSATPLADFYSTLPKLGESSLDYWIHLNQVIDLANECLKRQGKCVEDPGHEVAMMFIRHCPEPDLQCVFRCKPAEKWTVGEVQEMMDSYHRDKRLRPECKPVKTIASKKGEILNVSTDSHFSEPPVKENLPSYIKEEDNTNVERLITLLEKVIPVQGAYQHPVLPVTAGLTHSRRHNTCDICKDGKHSTKAHCMMNNLCFLCWQSGHKRQECPKRKLTHQLN